MIYVAGDSLDFNFITGRLATGGMICNLSQIIYLKEQGITHIINAMDEFDDSVLFTPDIKTEYLWNGVDDDGKQKPLEWFEKALNFALPALSQPKNKIYAHCAAGINRGPSLAYTILRAQGLSAVVAKDLIRQARPCAWIGYADQADLAVELLGYV